MAAPLTRYKVGGEDITDIFVDTTTVEDSLDDTIPSSILTPEGIEELLARSLWVWGAGDSGGLGLNATINRSSPIQLGSLTNWKHGTATNGATKTDGTLWTWGANTRGRLGLGDTINRSSPVQVGTNTNWAKFTTTSTTSFAITDSSALWTWGDASLGVQGRNTTTPTYNTTLNQVGTISNWKDVTGSSFYSRQQLQPGPPPRVIINKFGFAIGLRTDGTLWSWGAPYRFFVDSSNGYITLTQYGSTGLNEAIAKSSPTQIGTATDWKEIGNIIALKTSGSIWSWGSGTSGNLGLNTTFNRSSPTQIGADVDWKKIDRNGNAAIKNNGSLWIWGGPNNNGFLGLNDTIDRSSPTQIGSLLDWRSIITGSPCLALKTNGTLWTWGQNSVGGSGLNDTINRSSPIQVGTDTNWRNAGPGSRAFK